MDVSVTSAEAQRQLCWAKLKGQVPPHNAALPADCFQATSDEMAAQSYCSTSNNKDAQPSVWLRHQWHLAVHPCPWRCRGRNKQPFHPSWPGNNPSEEQQCENEPVLLAAPSKAPVHMFMFISLCFYYNGAAVHKPFCCSLRHDCLLSHASIQCCNATHKVLFAIHHCNRWLANRLKVSFSCDYLQIGLRFLQIAIWRSLLLHLSSDLDPCTRVSVYIHLHKQIQSALM